MPIPGRGQTPLSERIAELNRLAAEVGRGPIPVSVYGTLPRPEVIQQYAEVGVERCIFWLPPGPTEEVLPFLDRNAELANSFA